MFILMSMTGKRGPPLGEPDVYLPVGQAGPQRPAPPCPGRGKMNSYLIKFEDGYTMVKSRNALKLATDKE